MLYPGLKCKSMVRPARPLPPAAVIQAPWTWPSTCRGRRAAAQQQSTATAATLTTTGTPGHHSRPCLRAAEPGPGAWSPAEEELMRQQMWGHLASGQLWPRTSRNKQFWHWCTSFSNIRRRPLLGASPNLQATPFYIDVKIVKHFWGTWSWTQSTGKTERSHRKGKSCYFWGGKK